jgi:hypothetical protein
VLIIAKYLLVESCVWQLSTRWLFMIRMRNQYGDTGWARLSAWCTMVVGIRY